MQWVKIHLTIEEYHFYLMYEMRHIKQRKYLFFPENDKFYYFNKFAIKQK